MRKMLLLSCFVAGAVFSACNKSEPTAADLPPSSSEPQLRSQVRQLQAENASLRDRISDLEKMKNVSTQPPAAPSMDQFMAAIDDAIKPGFSAEDWPYIDQPAIGNWGSLYGGARVSVEKILSGDEMIISYRRPTQTMAMNPAHTVIIEGISTAEYADNNEVNLTGYAFYAARTESRAGQTFFVLQAFPRAEVERQILKRAKVR